MIRVIIIICGVIAIGLAFMSVRTSDTTLEFACDDFTNQGSAVSEEVVVDSWADSLIVSLCANPTTGFEWKLTELTDPTVLEYESNEYIAPESAEVAGAAGKEVWSFKVLRPGETTISMEYSRPWEGGEKATRTFVLSAVVE